MAKARKKNISEQTLQKKKDKKFKVNPFEIKVNRKKHAVLNPKYEKHMHGQPGVSRAKANQKVSQNSLYMGNWYDSLNNVICS